MKPSIIVLGSVLALGLAACETSTMEDGKMASKPDTLSAEALAKEFAKGSKACSWTKPDGTKGEDFYFKTSGRLSGDADRIIGDKTLQGTWKIAGTGFYTNFGSGKKALGNWNKLAKTAKNTYEVYAGDGSLAMTMKCS